MARVTVEDCIEKIPNRFELVMVASQRVRDINAGAPITVDRDRDKNPVVALREIADTNMNIDDLKEAMVKRNQRLFMSEEESEEQVDALEGEEAWANMAREALESGREDTDMDIEEDDAGEPGASQGGDDAADDESF